MKRALLVSAAVIALSGCSDESGGDGPSETLRTFMTAVSKDDVDAMWAHLSSAARSSHNGNRDLFRRTGVPDLHKQIPKGTPVPEAKTFLVLEVGEWTVSAAAIETPETAYAAPLRREDGRWKVDPGGKSLRLVAGPPLPGSAVGDSRRVDFSVYSRARDLDASLWLDERRQELRGAGGPAFTRYWAEPQEGLAPGPHFAVAFAQGNGRAAAIAWTFTAGLPG